MPHLNLPIDAHNILSLQGVDASVSCTVTERIALHLLASILLEQQYTNKLLREAEKREKAREARRA